MNEKKNIIAIDGPAASGKSTIAAKIAKRLNSIYINTGNMYRAVTYAALKAGIQLNPPDQEKINELLSKSQLEYFSSNEEEIIKFNGENISSKIRAPEIAANVSKIAAIPAVRTWLVEKQRKIVSQTKLAVMEGRDIGTVVFPDAKWKFFLTASPEVRARRRLEQSGETFQGSTVASVAREIAERDKIDSSRSVAPLIKADDAILIDSSNMTIDEVLDKICKIINLVQT